jgi:hypothetical protein
MVQDNVEMLAACGLDCGPCPTRRIPFDEKAAEQMVGWFREMGWLEAHEGVDEAIERGMYCKGCQGDRSIRWSDNCEILVCCVDERDQQHCGQCAELMSCEKLAAFASDEHAHHKEAVMRLRKTFGSL